MKIEKLILKYFASIKNALGVNEIEIDFSTSLNKICLLIGPNGSGKTSILSMFHPFADVGNLDVRNSMKLILPKKDGYKEIIIRKSKDELYTIRHYYTWHNKEETHSVKSYIELNGEELNPNGNVGSFRVCVSKELQLEPEYLKLIRLGENVTSLIDLSSTERKNFMGKVMSEIGLFLDYYKSISSKLRQLDEMISHNIDKLNKLDILDKTSYKAETGKMVEKLIKKESEYLELTNECAIYKNNIEEVEDNLTLRDRLLEITKKYNKMNSILSKKEQLESLDISFYEKEIFELEKSILTATNEIVANENLINNSLSHLNTSQEQLHSIEIQIDKEKESDKELGRMEDNLISIRLRLREYEDNLGDYTPNYTKAEIESFIVFLKNTQQVLSKTYEFGKKPVSKVISLIKGKKNVINYVNRHIIDLDETTSDKDSMFLSTLVNRFSMKSGMKIEFPCGEESECAAKILYNQIYNLLINAEPEDKNKDINFYKDMEYIYQNLMYILPEFTRYTDLINRLPDDIKNSFSMESIYDKISKNEIIYDDKKMNDLLSYITEYENYINLTKEYKIEEETLNRFSSISNTSYLKEQRDSLKEIIRDTKEKIFIYKENIVKLNEKIKEESNTLEIYTDTKETLEKYDEIKELYERYSKEYEFLKENREKVYETETKTALVKSEISRLKEEIFERDKKLSSYKSINKELRVMRMIYDEMTLTKRSYSSKEGIPLHLIKHCLGNTVELTNELLDIAYEGKIQLDEFNIDATEFTMPFYNNGFLIPDVKYASQGEISFLNIALAFSLSTQILQVYNIMLLDEVDGVLDINKREKFVKIIEKQIDIINAEQLFAITHNNMFSAYPVDILDFSFKNNKEDYPLANFIKIKIA